ncbi:MAG TPA: tRNA (guanosine(37)-N1)-methyltransferase TrmD [Actinomycetota bacterium]|nr:tRNA (guanosine(37)-N1)-methyltransferase TrmD [Actinomycetota bacterium]
MRFDVITIFPRFFDTPLDTGLLYKAREVGLITVACHDLRTWTHDRHRTVDDAPFGGGAGMVMRPEPWFEALDELAGPGSGAHVVLLAPDGARFDQRAAARLATRQRLVLCCGRYEGVDERVRTRVDEVISLGDFVLAGGETAALAVIEAVARLVPGVLGNAESATDESFSTASEGDGGLGLLEYPQYTRPASYRGLDVPEVLRSGDHGAVARWRRAQSVERTRRLRPDLLATADATDQERDRLAEGPRE